MQKMSTKTICLNRNPVCAADNVDEHKRVIVIPADMTVKDFIWMLRNDYIGNMLDDLSAQRASAEVARQGFHDYGKRDTPVYYFKRKTD